MNILLILPIIIPFVGAITCIFAWNAVRVQRLATITAMMLHLVVGILLLNGVAGEGIQAMQVGNWQAPIGITLVADLFSAIMITITGLMGFSVAVYSLSSIDHTHERFGYYPLYNTLIMGVSGAFLTGDMFNLYVWFEVLLISSFVLLALGGGGKQIAGAMQYVLLNLLSSALFLASVGVLYSIAGTLNMADLAQQIPNIQQPGIVTAVSLMLLVAFGIKAAIFPLFFWLPVSYHTPPVSVSAIFAALLTKVGVYALIRMFTLIFVGDSDLIHNLLLVLAAFTMVSGVFGAASDYDFRRILSFHIISQIGYMIMGLGIFTTMSLAGVIFFLLHNMVAKTTLFLVSGIAFRLRGTYQLKELGGLYRRYPLFGVMFLVPALGLAGIPPLSGFWAKFILVWAGLAAEQYLIIGISLFVGVFTLYSMIKIWAEGYLKADPNPESPSADFWQPAMLLMILPVIWLGLVVVLMGVAAEPLYNLCYDAAAQLIDPSEYIQAVLGATP